MTGRSRRLRARAAPGLFLAVVAAAVVAAVCSAGYATARSSGVTFAAAANQAEAALTGTFYVKDGLWRACTAAGCQTGNQDWGNDSLTYALALRFRATGSPRLLGLLRRLTASAPAYPAPCANTASCQSWSDVPEWDAIALAQEYLATRAPMALRKAEAAFSFVEGSRAYALGACPSIRYQQPRGGDNHLKTLETDANSIKAALLLFRATGKRAYLASARRRYEAVRAYFLDPAVPLYTVYVFDDGVTCTQLPHRFFASVNGDMIWSGLELSRVTRDRRYLAEALATARAVDRHLADGRRVFADLQAENDVAEPLVEGMDALAHQAHAAFARDWILRNAAAALSSRAPDGSFGRFFDGPSPTAPTTDWQTNGGIALVFAAANLAPRTVVAATQSWAAATFVAHEITHPEATLTFHGSGIALIGTLGEECCEAGHARVLLDGRETFDQTGIWQNKSSAGRSIPGTVLFAWRWATAGTHTIAFEPGAANQKEGGPFLHLQGYLLLDP